MKINFELESKRLNAYTDARVICKCGHSVLVEKRRKLCSWCGRFVYKNKKIEFEEKLKRALA